MAENKQMGENRDKPPWKVGLVKVTPEMAAEMLRNNYVNRPLNPVTIIRLAGDMSADLWIEPTVIYRTIDEKLLDAQHRLSAQVTCQKTLWYVVIDGVSEEIIDTIDSGTRRSDPQRLVMHGRPKETGSLFASMLGLVINYLEHHRIVSGGISFPKKWEYQGMHEEIEDYAQYWNDAELNGLHIKKTVLASFHFLAAKQNKEKADEFFNQLLSVDELEEGSPALALKEYVSKALPAKSQTQGQIRTSAIVLLQAWLAHLEDRTIKKIVPSAEIPRLPIKS
jgi:hypothetical protein